MFRIHADKQFKAYQEARHLLASQPEILIELEKYCSDTVLDLLTRHQEEIARDYDEASYLYSFLEKLSTR